MVFFSHIPAVKHFFILPHSYDPRFPQERQGGSVKTGCAAFERVIKERHEATLSYIYGNNAASDRKADGSD